MYVCCLIPLQDSLFVCPKAGAKLHHYNEMFLRSAKNFFIWVEFFVKKAFATGDARRFNLLRDHFRHFQTCDQVRLHNDAIYSCCF